MPTQSSQTSALGAGNEIGLLLLVECGVVSHTGAPFTSVAHVSARSAQPVPATPALHTH